MFKRKEKVMFRRNETKLIVENWKRFINENEKHLQNMRTLDEVKETLAQVDEQNIFKYNLGYTKEDGWFNNLLTFLKEKLEIDLEDEQVLSKEDFNRHFLAISAEFAEQCASKINKNYSVAGGIKEFIYEFLNKFYAFKK